MTTYKEERISLVFQTANIASQKKGAKDKGAKSSAL
jgi:hypothetical protein